MEMNRRNVLFGGAAMVVLPNAGLACPSGYVSQAGNRCVPDFAGKLKGDRQIKKLHYPELCQSNDNHRLMTQDERGRVTTVANWDYAFWHGGRNAPYDIGTVVTGQCHQGQGVPHGTRIINWFNCKEINNGKWTGRWLRYWSATRPVVDNGRYVLAAYYVEEVNGFNSQPPHHSHWPRPR